MYRTKWTMLLGFLLFASALAQDAAPPEKSPLDPPEEPLDTEIDSLFVDREKEQGIVRRLFAATDDAAQAKAALAEMGGRPTELMLRALRNMDRELSASSEPQHRELIAIGIQQMSLSGDPNTLQYLHKVFDTHPERRAAVAVAIAELVRSGRRRPHEWPLLVRSLTVIDETQAPAVIHALLLYRERALNRSVQRNLIILAQRLRPDDQPPALELLGKWVRPDEPVADSVTAWQAWFTKEFPSLPPPAMPTENPASKHLMGELTAYLQTAKGDAVRGAALFEKALCIKCHHVQQRGEKVGPDLTRVVERLTTRELVESILFPAQQIPDEFVTRRVLLKDGREFSGMLGEKTGSVTILTSAAAKIEVPREDVQETHASPLSAMPTGLLDNFTRDDIADLLAYLHAAAEDSR